MDTDDDDAAGLFDTDEEAFEDTPMDDPDADNDNEVTVEVLTPQYLYSTQLAAIEEVNSIFQIPPATARILLQHYQWDRERLLDRYYGGDTDKMFEEARCVNPATLMRTDGGGGGAGGAAGDGAGPAAECECGICMCDYSPDEMTRVACGCVYCNTCWREHLTTTILEQGRAEVRCPSDTCDKLVDEFAITKLLQAHPDCTRVLSKYQAALSRDFVASNKTVKFCPAPGCDNAIRLSSGSSSRPFTVTCKCSASAAKPYHSFCFTCLCPPHDPVRCELLAVWLKKCADDSETSNWIAANTKECPKCHSTIEKHGGCNHMTCPQASCRYDFCWVCLGPWAPHGSSWYNCNRYEKEDAVAARDAESKSRALLERYLFYFNRYANHRQSLHLEDRLRAMVEDKTGTIQRVTGMSWIEVQFLAKAVDVLRECRTVLMYTYVFAYYLAKNNECAIFESNQKDLEMATEMLSGFLERDLEHENITMSTVTELKQKVLDKAKYCSQRHGVLLDHVKEGVGRKVWEYAPESVSKLMASLPPL